MVFQYNTLPDRGAVCECCAHDSQTCDILRCRYVLCFSEVTRSHPPTWLLSLLDRRSCYDTSFCSKCRNTTWYFEWCGVVDLIRRSTGTFSSLNYEILHLCERILDVDASWQPRTYRFFLYFR